MQFYERIFYCMTDNVGHVCKTDISKSRTFVSNELETLIIINNATFGMVDQFKFSNRPSVDLSFLLQ